MVKIMELKKYKDNNYKRKSYVILVIGFLLLSISSYLFYKSYAFYEERKNFDVINGIVEDPGDIYFAYYIDGVISRNIPVQNTGYTLDETKSNCNNGVVPIWDNAVGNLLVIIIIIAQPQIQEQNVFYILIKQRKQ